MSRRSEHPSPGPHDEDPTGVRDLLSSLPDPGPMPPEVAERIRSRIEQELTVVGVGGPTDLAAERERRQPRLRLLVGIAAAAVLLVAGGAILTGQVLPRGGVTASGADDAASAESGAGGATEGLQAPRTGEERGDVPVVLVLATGRSYDSSELAKGAAGLLDLPTPLPVASGSPTGAVTTPSGARACADALGVPSTSPVVVDLATVDGEPAAILLAGPAAGAAKHTAYAVGLSCSTDEPRLIAGPVSVG